MDEMMRTLEQSAENQCNKSPNGLSVDFHALCETFFEAEGAPEKEIYTILCHRLRQLCDAQLVALASYDLRSQTMRLEAVETRSDNGPSPIRGDPDLVVSVPEEVMSTLREAQGRPGQGHTSYSEEWFARSLLATVSPEPGAKCYQVLCTYREELMAAGVVCLRPGQSFAMTEMLDRYLNLAGVLIHRARTSEALKESEERYRTVVELATDGIAIIQGSLARYVNRRLAEMAGYSPEELIGTPFVRYVHPDDFPEVVERQQRRMAGEDVPSTVETAIKSKSGERVDIEVSAGFITYRGEPAELIIVREISERKRMEREIRESEEKYKTLVEDAPIGVYYNDFKGRFLYGNRKAEEIIGYKREDLMGESFLHLELFDPKGVSKAVKLFARNRLGQATGPDEFVLNRKDGSKRIVEIRTRVVTIGNGKAVLGMVEDITERKRAEELLQKAYQEMEFRVAERTAELERSNQQLRQEIAERWRVEEALRKAHARSEQMLTSISSILVGVDDDDRVRQWNATAENTFGLTAEEVIGRPIQECGLRWEWKRVIEGISTCRKEKQPTRLDDVRLTRTDGKEGFLGMTLYPIIGEDSDQLGFLMLGMDITERKILENQLAHAQKLESIGLLAAGIAHEINTPTQYVGDNTRFLKESFGDLQILLGKYEQLLNAAKAGNVTPELIAETESALLDADVEYLAREIPTAIEESLEGIERVAKIVRAMREFSHPGGATKKAIDLNRAIESTITVARNEWKYVAEVETDYDPDLPLVLCLPSEFNQVILNILINAAHAIADVVGDGVKGQIIVTTRHDGDWVEIRISDTGTGIPQEIRSKVFDPFFTTKEVGKGTGQGLAIAHSVVVKQHGGTVTFETEMGKGTTFIIRLPIEGNGEGKSNSEEDSPIRR